MNLSGKVAKIKEIVSGGKRFLVASHMDPDGDAIGSSLAMAGHLSEPGRDVTVYNRHGVPQNLRFLKQSDKVTSKLGKGYDVTFILDCSEPTRISDDVERNLPKLGRIINIDHHKTSKGLGEVNIIDQDASSTAELIFRVFKEANASVDRDIATALYTALLTDTGSFRYSNSSPKAFQMAAELVKLGAKPWDVAQNYYENIPVAKLKLTSKVLSTLEIYEKDGFASLTMTGQMVSSSQAKPEFSDGLINYPRSIEGIEVAIMFKELSPEEYKIGLRSKGAVDVSEIAQTFGGGGHRNAAGCTVRGDLSSVKSKLYDRTRQTIRKYRGNSAGK